MSRDLQDAEIRFAPPPYPGEIRGIFSNNPYVLKLCIEQNFIVRPRWIII